MSTTEFQLTQDKYLFTFQDETQLWISKEFIEKYQQLPFYDIIEHSEKYEDGSYYIDMSSSSMKTVIHFLMEENVDISSLNLRDSYDIYKTLYEYSVTIHNEMQSDLLFHIKELFLRYLNDNNYSIYEFYNYDNQISVPMELFSSREKRIIIKGLITSPKKDELLYYSFLFKMMNITRVSIEYEYASNIPIEYICPSSIQEIFPLIQFLTISVFTNYIKNDILLNPNSDEYMNQYYVFYRQHDFQIRENEKYDYYTESEINKYNVTGSLERNQVNYLQKIHDSYNERRQVNKLPKLYECILDEAAYNNDYTQIKSIKKTYDHVLKSTIIIDFQAIDSKYLCNSLIKAFEENYFDFITTLNIKWITKYNNFFGDNKFEEIITKHIFPNVTTLIYDDKDFLFPISLIKSDYFPKLQIIYYNVIIDDIHLDFLFPKELISVIHTIHLNDSCLSEDELNVIAPFFDELAYNQSIHIFGFYSFLDYFPHEKELIENGTISLSHTLRINSNRLDSMKDIKYYVNNKNAKLDNICIKFDRNKEEGNNVHDNTEKRREIIKQLFMSDIIENLQRLEIAFYENLSIEDLKWILSIFKDNKLKRINKLIITYMYNKENLLLINETTHDNSEKSYSSEYLLLKQNIYEYFIPKALNVEIIDSITGELNKPIYENLVQNGCFHNSTEIYIHDLDMLPEVFFDVFTKQNFPRLKKIQFYNINDDYYIHFIDTLHIYNNETFPSVTEIVLTKPFYKSGYFSYNPSSAHLLKYEISSSMDTIAISKCETFSEYELSLLLDCIKEKKVSNLKHLELYYSICCENKTLYIDIMNTIINGEIPNLKEFICYFDAISDIMINSFKQQIKDSAFIQKNHVFNKFMKTP
ncbi:hypothetical protein WA158_000216 [Blastocystis sp. Blastoise]